MAEDDDGRRSAKISQFLVESNQLAAVSDTRFRALQQWLGTRFPGGSFTLAPASADASFRRYFRVSVPGASWIAMDAPPEQEDCRPFIHVAMLLRGAGVNAPDVVAHDLARGFLLLTDLGDRTYLSALNEESADPLIGDAIGRAPQMAACEPGGRTPAVRRATAPAGVRPLWRVVCRAPSSDRALRGSKAVSDRHREAHHRAQHRAAVGLRAPRLYAPQPHDRRSEPGRSRFSGRRVWPDYL